jgi:hypothetical protein
MLLPPTGGGRQTRLVPDLDKPELLAREANDFYRHTGL